MKNEIRIRKRRFLAAILTFLLLLNQLPPLSARAAEYAVETLSSDRILAPGDTISNNSDTPCAITYYNYGETVGELSSGTITQNAAHTVPTYTGTAPDGFKFTGWQVLNVNIASGDVVESITLEAMVAIDGTEIVESLSGTTLAAGTVIYSSTDSYTITYYDQNGKPLGESETISVNTPYKVNEYTGTVSEGSKFAGWKVSYVWASGGAGEINLTAQFALNQYTITFDTDGGSPVDAITADYGEDVTAPANPTREGYTFEGWDKEIPQTMPAENVTITAQWTANKYIIKFVNEDGTELQSGEVAYDETPVYNGATPTKEATAEYSYVFSGWTPAIAAVTGDATYKATYTTATNKYTIKFVDEDGTELQSSEVAYGETPAYTGETPTKAATAQYTYTFANWSPAITEVTGDATYKATYTTATNKYTVKFVNEDGTELQSSEVAYGAMPAYTGETPTKAATAQYTYTFAEWDAEILPVTGNATYRATYSETVNKYTIKFVDEDGTELQSSAVAYGETPVYSGETPTKAATAQYTYTFADWSPVITEVTGDATYKATYTTVTNKYTVKFLNEDGTELQSSEVAYGETPAYTGETPTKAATAQYTYSFDGWDAEITPVSGNATYRATYTETVNQYTIKFVDEDGTELQSSEVAYGETPVYNGETPTKAATAQYTYTFADWSPAITEVTGDAIYKATYTTVTNKYTVKFVNEDGTELQSSEVAYGEKPTYTGETPTKAATAQYTYTFADWSPAITEVTGDATYKATYTTVTNKYTVKFVNEDGTELQSGEVAYGETPVYSGETLTKEATAEHSYTFAGWTPEIAVVSGDATYTATFTEIANRYTIEFVDEDGTVLQSSQIAYGETPVYNGEMPTKTATAQYTYSFDGWDAEIVPVSGNATYRATYSETVNKYTIKFVDEDGTELQSSEVDYGEMPVYNGETPTKAATAQYTYTFADWSPAITEVTGDATYKATYTTATNKYTVKFVNEDGTELQSIEVAYGETPAYTGETPTKAATAQYTYSFVGWDAEIVPVSGNATYRATYSESVNKYTIKFVDEDGTELQSDEVAYGETPIYSGAIPTGTATAQYTDTFAGWSPTIAAVTGEATYTAVYTRTANKYTIQFVNEDGTQLQSSEVSYGETPAYTGETPTKAATAQYTYTFADWSPAITEVTGDATYKATYTTVTNKYTVKFVNENGTELQSSEVAYGAMPAYTGETPTKAATAQYTYAFEGWSPVITEVTGDATYKATYTTATNKYTVKFVDEDGTELQNSEVAYGEMPVYNGITPTKAATAQYTYTFANWSPAITEVTGDATYKATYTTATNKYTVKFVNEDGTELQSSEVAYGETPTYTGETPTKAATAQYTYTFADWSPAITEVTGDATYKATYTTATNKYIVKFVNEDGTELQSSEVAYGETPAYTGETPTKAAMAQYTYSFVGWDAEIVPVSGNATYRATYAETVNKYTIKFVDEDGTELQSSEVAYGETPVYSGETPTKAATAQYTYTFSGWTPAIAAVTGDATYTAVYAQTANKYTITFNTVGGSEIASITQGYGTTVAAPANPTRNGYTFAGWDKSVPTTMPAENITITARWTANSYSIHYILNGGTNGKNPGSYTYGTGVSGFANAVKPGYTFAGWYENADFNGDRITSVAANRTGDITLYAKFEMGTIGAGTYSLTAGVAYKLGNVTKVSGDNSVYTAGSIFYVPVSGLYTFS